MHAIMEREIKKTSNDNYPIVKGKAFFLSKHITNKSDTKMIISGQVSNIISNDFKKLTHIMANNIIEGLTYERKQKTR